MKWPRRQGHTGALELRVALARGPAGISFRRPTVARSCTRLFAFVTHGGVRRRAALVGLEVISVPKRAAPDRPSRGHHRRSAATDRRPKRTLAGALLGERVILRQLFAAFVLFELGPLREERALRELVSDGASRTVEARAGS